MLLDISSVFSEDHTSSILSFFPVLNASHRYGMTEIKDRTF